MTYRQPAEWAQHDWAWIGFPSNPAEWPNAFEGARMQAAAFANAVHANGKGEEVRLVAADAASADAARVLVHAGVTVQTLPFGDIWLRDTGPIAVSNGQMRALVDFERSEEHTSELQSLMRISYAVFCLKKKNQNTISKQ